MSNHIHTLTDLATKLNELVTKHHGIILKNTQLNYQLREAEAERIETLASFSHEMKKPLAILRSLLWQLQCDSKKITHDELADKMDKEIGRATALLDNVITLNKLELRKISPPIDIDISQSCRAELARYELRFPQHSWHAKIESDLHLTISPELIFGILENLLENAAKYTPDRGMITLRLYRKASNIVLSVSDTGVGMTLAEQARVLMPFQRGNTAVAGSGLGLTILTRAIEQLAAKLNIQSKKNIGSVFTVTIPYL